MKEHWKFNKEKFISAEEGLTSTEPVTGGSIRKCDSLIKYVKLILYIEVILFLGWSGYILYQSNYFAIRDVECSTVPAEVLKLSSLKELEYTVDEIKTKERGLSKEDVITTEILPTNDQLNVHGASRENDINLNENERFKDTLKPKSNEDKEILVKVPSLDASEFKESDSLEDGSIMDWGFPFLWQIHKEIVPSTDDSTDTVSDSEVDEKDESNDASESYQASLDKTEEWLNGEGSYSSEDIRYSMEILKNLSDLLEMMKAARENSNLESLRKDDDSSESRENLKNNKESLLWEESTGLNVSLPNELGNGILIWKPVESENLDTSEADEMISDPKSDFWTPSITPRVVVPSVEEQSDGETQYTEDSTEKNAFMETDNAATKEEDSSPIVSKRWKSFFNVPSDTATSLEIENAHPNSSTADTNEEDSSPFVSKRWKSFINFPSDTATSFQIENAESNLSTADTNEEDYSPLVMNRFSNLHYNSESTGWEAPAATTNDENSSTMDNIWGSLATSPTDTATPLPKENVASATHITDTSDEENGAVIDNAWGPLWNSYDDPDISSSKENKDLVIDYTWGSLSDSYDDYAVDTSSATNNEEDGSLSTDRPQERFSNVDDIFARHFKMESADEEKKDIQFGPRLKTDDLTDPCSVEFVNGIRILKCSWNSADGSSDSSVTTESVNDSKTKGFYIFHKEPWASKVAIRFGR